MKPVNPTFPFFTAVCSQCGGSTHSLSAACGVEPWTYVCFVCQDDATREAVRLHVNAQVNRFKQEQPVWVAAARRALGLRRPYGLPPSADWMGCAVEDRRPLVG